MNKDGIYIIKSTSSSYSTPQKIKVLEVTEKTYYIHNLDSGSKYRELKEMFNRDYKIIEEVAVDFTNIPKHQAGYMDTIDFTYKSDLWSQRRFNNLFTGIEELDSKLYKLYTYKDKE